MEKSLFLEFVGDSPMTRILDVLMDELGLELTKTDIAKKAELSRTTVFNHWPGLEKNGIVKETRRFGNTKLYTINRESAAVQKLLELEFALIKKDWSEVAEEEVLLGLS